MASGEQLNLKPHFDQTSVPCEGEVGDLIVLTPLREGEPDGSPQGVASFWLCIKASHREQLAVWARVQFDGIATCEVTVPEPPQTHPTLQRG